MSNDSRKGLQVRPHKARVVTSITPCSITPCNKPYVTLSELVGLTPAQGRASDAPGEIVGEYACYLRTRIAVSDDELEAVVSELAADARGHTLYTFYVIRAIRRRFPSVSDSAIHAAILGVLGSPEHSG